MVRYWRPPMGSQLLIWPRSRSETGSGANQHSPEPVAETQRTAILVLTFRRFHRPLDSFVPIGLIARAIVCELH
jgi:hypothetical protein